MHPFAAHRQGIVERSRVGKILAGDKSADKSMIQKAMSQHEARIGEPKMKARGGPIGGKMSHGRLDKPHRASGGRVKAPVEVNVVVAPSKDKMPGLGMGALPPAPVPAPGPVGAPGGAPAGPGLPPGMPPPPMMRKRGGRVKRAEGGLVERIIRDTGSKKLANRMGGDPPWQSLYSKRNSDAVREDMRNDMERSQNVSDSVPRKRGGRVGKLTSAKAEGMKNGTPVQNDPSGKIEKPDDFTTWPPITKAKGGRVSPMSAGAASGEGRLEKADWYAGRARKG